MAIHSGSALVLSAATMLAACGPAAASSGRAPDSANRDAPRDSHAIVVSGRQLGGGATSLLSVLRNRIAGIHVDDRGACPTVILRSRKSILGDNSAVVYVNGARAANTCVLDMMDPASVARVEVYPQGITRRPGYESHANGLILVFLLDASEPEAR